MIQKLLFKYMMGGASQDEMSTWRHEAKGTVAR